MLLSPNASAAFVVTVLVVAVAAAAAVARVSRRPGQAIRAATALLSVWMFAAGALAQLGIFRRSPGVELEVMIAAVVLVGGLVRSRFGFRLAIEAPFGLLMLPAIGTGPAGMLLSGPLWAAGPAILAIIALVADRLDRLSIPALRGVLVAMFIGLISVGWSLVADPSVAGAPGVWYPTFVLPLAFASVGLAWRRAT